MQKRCFREKLSLLGFLLLFLLAACGLQSGQDRMDIEAIPGAYGFKEGETSYPDLYRRATEKLKAGEYPQAEAIYLELADKEPENPLAYIGLAASLIAQERFEEAVDAYLQALDESPNSVEALIGLGSAHAMLGNHTQAAQVYSRALQINDEEINAHWGLALQLEAVGRVQEAIEHYERIIELSPGSQFALDAEERISGIGAINE